MEFQPVSLQIVLGRGRYDQCLRKPEEIQEENASAQTSNQYGRTKHRHVRHVAFKMFSTPLEWSWVISFCRWGRGGHVQICATLAAPPKRCNGLSWVQVLQICWLLDVVGHANNTKSYSWRLLVAGKVNKINCDILWLALLFIWDIWGLMQSVFKAWSLISILLPGLILNKMIHRDTCTDLSYFSHHFLSWTDFHFTMIFGTLNMAWTFHPFDASWAQHDLQHHGNMAHGNMADANAVAVAPRR